MNKCSPRQVPSRPDGDNRSSTNRLPTLLSSRNETVKRAERSPVAPVCRVTLGLCVHLWHPWFALVLGFLFLPTLSQQNAWSDLPTTRLTLPKRLWIHASRSEAESLHIGCAQQPIPSDRRPSFIILGVQKGGTSSAVFSMRKYACYNRPRTSTIYKEAHFFDRDEYANSTIPIHDYYDLYWSAWKHCQQDAPTFEKSPLYIYQAWTPLRMCETLGPKQRLVLFLREPAARAYSGFYQGWRKHSLVPKTPEGFDTLARLEVAIVKSCGGLPSGDLDADWKARATFRSCCRSVTTRLNFSDWPGCGCELEIDTDPRHVDCGVFGMWPYAQIRGGIYAPLVRNFLRYIRTDQLYIYIVEQSMFPSMPRVLWEILCAISPVAPEECQGELPSLGESVQKHSTVKKQRPMLEQTASMLSEFFHDYNRDLEAVLGHKLPW